MSLALTGRYLFDVVLPQCDFGQIGFPFAKDEKKTKINTRSENETFGRLILNESMEGRNADNQVSISDHGAKLVLTTQFGQCETILTRENIR